MIFKLSLSSRFCTSKLRRNLMSLIPLSKGSSVPTEGGLLLVHWSNFGRMPFLPPGGSGVSGLTRVWRPSPKVEPGAFSCQTQGWKTPKRTPWQCTASLCVAGVHCWEISLGLADPGNVIFCLSNFVLGLSYVYCIVSSLIRVVLLCCIL